MEHAQSRARARSEAGVRSDFYGHLGVYVAVNLLLVVINLINWPGYLWAVWPLLGWGIGVAVHAVQVFVFHGREPDHRSPLPRG